MGISFRLAWAFVGLAALHAVEMAVASEEGFVTPAGSKNSFVFGYPAPDAKTVLLRGDWTADPLALVRDDHGVWTGRAENIPAGTHEYYFLIDALDPSAATASACVLHVPREGQTEYAATVPRGTIHAHRYHSHALNLDRECWVYTPPGYEKETGFYPLLVLQHAGADTRKTWVEKGSVDWLLDQLIATGRARPMIVLMIDGHPQGESAYLKTQTRAAAMRDLQGELFDDALPLVETHYRVAPSRESRAFAGPSVGGGQVLSIGLAHLDRFASLGVFSAGHALPELYEPALADAAATNARLKLFWISCAAGDAEFKNNEQFVSLLRERGIHHEWHPTEGAHSWQVWRRDLTEFLTRVFL